MWDWNRTSSDHSHGVAITAACANTPILCKKDNYLPLDSNQVFLLVSRCYERRVVLMVPGARIELAFTTLSGWCLRVYKAPSRANISNPGEYKNHEDSVLRLYPHCLLQNNVLPLYKKLYDFCLFLVNSTAQTGHICLYNFAGLSTL